LGEVEGNKKVPRLDTIVAMADALGISLESVMKAEREETRRIFADALMDAECL
jgi:hypothetical protein